MGILRLACRLFRDRPKVDFPPIESFTVNGDTTVNLSAEGSIQGPYAQKPKSEDDPGVTDTRATGKAEGTLARSIGATHFSSGPRAGQTTVYYEVSSAGELSGDVVIGPLVNAALGGKLTGKARVAITVDATGKPLSLSVINTVEGEVNGGLKNSRSTTFGDIADTIPFYAREVRGAKGKGTEITTTLDLTDPRLAAAAQRAWTGRDPVTGEPVDRSDAAGELGEAARDASRFTLRTYDYDKTTDRHDVDLVVAGGAAEFGSRDERTTGYGTFDPETEALHAGPTAARADRDALRPRAARRLRQRRAGAHRAGLRAARAPGRPGRLRAAARDGLGDRRARRLRQRAPLTSEERRELTLLAAPAQTAGLPGQLAVARSAASPGDFGAGVEVLKAENRLERSEYRLVDERDARVPGARLARRVEATYVQPDGTPVRTVDLVVHGRGGVRYAVFARAPEADFARLRLAEAVDSFRVR